MVGKEETSFRTPYMGCERKKCDSLEETETETETMCSWV
jgi:hypothetical protein